MSGGERPAHVKFPSPGRASGVTVEFRCFGICEEGKRFQSLKFSRIVIFVLFWALFLAGAGSVSAFQSFPAKVTLLQNREFADALIAGIRNSRKTVLLCYYLFKISPSGSGHPGRIAEELVKAGERGVTVTVVLEISDDPGDQLNEENRKTASRLSSKGIRVLFDSPGRRSHLKTAMIDDRYVYIGSHNLTQSALKYNNEISVLIDSPAMAREVRQYIKSLPDN